MSEDVITWLTVAYVLGVVVWGLVTPAWICPDRDESRIGLVMMGFAWPFFVPVFALVVLGAKVENLIHGSAK